MTFPIDLPEEINDETAATMVDFLYALGDAVANRYYAQIRRYYDDQRQDPTPPRRRQATGALPRTRQPVLAKRRADRARAAAPPYQFRPTLERRRNQ